MGCRPLAPFLLLIYQFCVNGQSQEEFQSFDLSSSSGWSQSSYWSSDNSDYLEWGVCDYNLGNNYYGKCLKIEGYGIVSRTISTVGYHNISLVIGMFSSYPILYQTVCLCLVNIRCEGVNVGGFRWRILLPQIRNLIINNDHKFGTWGET